MKSTGTSPEKSLIWRQYVNTMHSLKVSEFNQPDDLVASNRLCICIFCTIQRRAMAYFRIRKVKRIPWNGNMEVVHNENLSSKRLRWSSLISLTNIDLQSTNSYVKHECNMQFYNIRLYGKLWTGKLWNTIKSYMILRVPGLLVPISWFCR